MFCPKCGKENYEEARFCQQCGFELYKIKLQTAPPDDSGRESLIKDDKSPDLISSKTTKTKEPSEKIEPKSDTSFQTKESEPVKKIDTEEKSYLDYCPRCNYFDSKHKICEKFEFIVPRHTKEFSKICNGEYFYDEFLPEEMECPSCNKLLELEREERIKNKFICPECMNLFHRNKNNVLVSSPYSSVDRKVIPDSQIRPWVRYFARMIDYYFAACFISIFLSVFLDFIFEMNIYLLVIITFIIWLFIEAFFLSTWGTTPGKWLYNAKVRESSTGEKLIYSKALKRSFLVFWRGVAFGIPIILLFTHYAAYKELIKNGITTWDRDGGYIVTHEKIGIFRILLIILVFILMVLINALSEGV